MTFSISVVHMLAHEGMLKISKIKTRLGYRTQFTTAEGSIRMVTWSTRALMEVRRRSMKVSSLYHGALTHEQ
jgi:hypothetical protein